MSVTGVGTDHAAAGGPDAAATQLRATAGMLVGRVFFGTLLQAMRESGLRGKYGHGGRGEEVFRGQLDGVLAERMGQSGGGGLTDAIVRAYEKQARLMRAPTRERG